MSPSALSTPFTRLLNIRAPIALAGMNVAAGPDLAAEVSNAGGIGVLGGVGEPFSTFKLNLVIGVRSWCRTGRGATELGRSFFRRSRTPPI